MHHLLPGRGLRLVRGPPPRLEAICYGRAREGIRRIPEWLWWKVWRGVTGWLRSQHCESRNVVDMIREGGGARGILRPRLGDVQLTARATRMSFAFPPCRLTLPAGRRSLPSHAGVRYFAHAHRPAGSDGPGERRILMDPKVHPSLIENFVNARAFAVRLESLGCGTSGDQAGCGRGGSAPQGRRASLGRGGEGARPDPRPFVTGTARAACLPDSDGGAGLLI